MTPQEALDVVGDHADCIADYCYCGNERLDEAVLALTKVVSEYERLSLIEQLQASIAEERSKRERGAPA